MPGRILKSIQLKVSEVSQKSNVKIVTYVKRKTSKSKANWKKAGRTSPDVQFQELSMTKPKLDLVRTMGELGKPFLKNNIKNIKKKQKINVKKPNVNRKHQRETKKARPRMNYEWIGKTI